MVALNEIAVRVMLFSSTLQSKMLTDILCHLRIDDLETTCLGNCVKIVLHQYPVVLDKAEEAIRDVRCNVIVTVSTDKLFKGYDSLLLKI